MVAPRFASRSSILIDLQDRRYMCQVSRCDASSSMAVMALSASVSRTCRSAVATWLSRNRPCDRLLHKSFENTPLSASCGTPSANPVPVIASGVDDQLPQVLIPPPSCDASMSGAVSQFRCFVSVTVLVDSRSQFVKKVIILVFLRLRSFEMLFLKFWEQGPFRLARKRVLPRPE